MADIRATKKEGETFYKRSGNLLTNHRLVGSGIVRHTETCATCQMQGTAGSRRTPLLDQQEAWDGMRDMGPVIREYWEWRE